MPGTRVRKLPFGLPSWHWANQLREPRPGITLNHMRYLGPELSNPLAFVCSRFLAPFSDFQQPCHSGPWGTLDIFPSLHSLPNVGLSLTCLSPWQSGEQRGHVIQLTRMSTGPSTQWGLKSAYCVNDEYTWSGFSLPVSR